MYKRLTLYYFSGTGNALTAIRWIAESARRKGTETDLVPIDRLGKISPPPSEGKRLIGFCYPTHGFNLPWIMLKFIARFPAVKDCDVFLLNTRAGSKIGRWFAPGISGVAQILPALVLLLKGFTIRGMLPLDMPSNWISVHPGYNQATIDAIFKRSRAMVDDFCGKILSGRRYVRSNVFIMLPVDLLLAPIAFGYFMYGRFLFAKIFIASTDCDTCRLCEEKCPTESIRIIDGRPFWKFTCESCMRCINICPRKAIQVSHSLAAVIIGSGSFVPLLLILDLFHPYIPGALTKSADFFIRWGIMLAVYFIVSGIVFWLMRARFVNRIFTWTSLTRYWRRYMATGIKAKDYTFK